MRGVTRKLSSLAVRQWHRAVVNIVFGDLDDSESLRRPVQDAAVVYGVTDFWQHLKDPQVQRQAAKSSEAINAVAFKREIAQGRVCVGTIRPINS